MSVKGGGTQGYRYYLSLLSGLCRWGAHVVEIRVGDKPVWSGDTAGGETDFIDAPEIFGGDDKEGGIQGPFRVFSGAKDQVLPGIDSGLPSIKASIGGRVPEMRGVTTLWFDGLVAAMNPYLKTWKFRVQRGTDGWHDDDCWYPEKAVVYLGGNSVNVTTNRASDLPVSGNDDSKTITFTRNVQEGDAVTINGVTINYVAEKPEELEIVPNYNRERSVRNLANYVNARSTQFKVVASYTATTVTFKPDFAKQKINAMNPAHIVYQCYTDPAWGRGFPRSFIDENSFIYAANRLCNEAFGLTIIWYRKEDVDQFIQKVCDLVGAVTYTDRETGLLVFKLVRDDYDINDVPLFTYGTGLLSIDADDSASSDNSYNEIIGSSIDPVTNLGFQVRAQNLAAFQAQGSISSLDQDYKGIPTKELLQRVTLRDLRAMGSGLKKYNLTLDRKAWRVTPGSVIRVSAPERGLTNVVLRVAEIDDGNMVNGAIKVKAAIDVFGLPDTVYQESVQSGWAAPSRVAVPPPDERLVEVSYRNLYRRVGAGDAQAAQATDTFIGQLATPPNATTLEYDLQTRPDGGGYQTYATGPFTGNAMLSLDLLPTDTVATFEQATMFDADNIGQVLLIGDEAVRLDAIDTDASTITITRGVEDTLPQAHKAGDLFWTIDDDLVSDKQTYATGETVFSRVLTRTASQVLDPALADELSIVLAGRQARPYPPANVEVDGVSIYEARGEAPEPVITWATRNRITQGDQVVGYFEPSIDPEDGTTYRIRIYEGDNLVRSVEDIAETTFTYDADMQAADNVTAANIRVELESVRDGLTSWQTNSFIVALKAGWGYGWGTNWGL